MPTQGRPVKQTPRYAVSPINSAAASVRPSAAAHSALGAERMTRRFSGLTQKPLYYLRRKKSGRLNEGGTAFNARFNGRPSGAGGRPVAGRSKQPENGGEAAVLIKFDEAALRFIQLPPARREACSACARASLL